MFAVILLGVVILIITVRAALVNARQIIAAHPRNLTKYLGTKKTGDILLVIAHPDDECMFFSPTIIAIKKMISSSAGKTKVHLLCLTSGNADGHGNVRKGELDKACKVLGIDVVHVHDDQKRIPDSMKNRWDISESSKIIKEYLANNLKIGTVITFDAFGISGHPNHCDTNLSVRKALCETTKAYELYELVSLPLALKYMGAIGIIYEAVNLLVDTAITKLEQAANSLPTDPDDKDEILDVPVQFVCLISFEEALRYGFGAMKCHASQLVWFRYLHLCFSRYLHVNVLVHKKIKSTRE